MNSNRYDTAHLAEFQFEPGSRGRVLNFLPVAKRAVEIAIEQDESAALDYLDQ